MLKKRSSLQEVKNPELNKKATPQHYAKLDEALQAENEEALRGSSNDKKVHFSAPQNEFSPHPTEEETVIEQLYTQVKRRACLLILTYQKMHQMTSFMLKLTR